VNHKELAQSCDVKFDLPNIFWLKKSLIASQNKKTILFRMVF
jgi:hypothetical protein